MSSVDADPPGDDRAPSGPRTARAWVDPKRFGPTRALDHVQ
jgi:hypothetical protein